MSTFKPMDPQIAAELINGHKDVLSEKNKKEQDFYESVQCPRCGCSVTREMDVLLKDNAITTRYLARCIGCRCLFNPDLGIIIEMGNLANLEPEIPIVYGD
jgi:hypothetical protein